MKSAATVYFAWLGNTPFTMKVSRWPSAKPAFEVGKNRLQTLGRVSAGMGTRTLAVFERS